MDRQDHGDPTGFEDGLLLLEAKWQPARGRDGRVTGHDPGALLTLAVDGDAPSGSDSGHGIFSGL